MDLNQQIQAILEDLEECRTLDRYAIEDKWYEPSPLFAFVTRSGQDSKVNCGCLTEIASQREGVMNVGAFDKHDEPSPLLAGIIVKDGRIPSGGVGISPENLEAFAAWQIQLRQYYADERGIDALLPVPTLATVLGE